MIPALPAELLIKILDLATSPSYAVSARKDDHQLLRQCCLVSKQLCAAAQPKLWSIFTIEEEDGLVHLPDFPEHIRQVRTLGYRLQRRREPLGNAAQMLQNLNNLTVVHGRIGWVELRLDSFKCAFPCSAFGSILNLARSD